MTKWPLSNLIALPLKAILATFVISSSPSGNVAGNTHLSWSGSYRAATYFPDQKLKEVPGATLAIATIASSTV